MARQAPETRPTSPADLLPPGLRGALKREGTAAASKPALAQQARSAARRRGAADLSAAAQKAVRTKGPVERSAAARKAARTRAGKRRGA